MKIHTSKRGALGYFRNCKTEGKKTSKTAKPQKIRPKPKTGYTRPSKTYTTVTSGAYSPNCTNTEFVKIFVNAMDLSEAFISLSIFWLLQASLFPLHFTSKRVFLEKILAACPLLVKKKPQSKKLFFRCWRGRHIELHRKVTKWIALVFKVKVSRIILIIRDVWSPATITFSFSHIPLNNFGFLRLFEINCRSNRREGGIQIGQNRKNQKPHCQDAKTEIPLVFCT